MGTICEGFIGLHKFINLSYHMGVFVAHNGKFNMVVKLEFVFSPINS